MAQFRDSIPHLVHLMCLQIVGVKSREIVLNAGNVHCITQQFPAAS